MIARFVLRFSAGAAILAATAFTASAQYDEPAGAVVSGEVTQQVSAQEASTIAAGISGGGGAGIAGGGLFGPSGDTTTSQLPTTNYFEGGNRGRSAGAADKRIGAWVLGSYSSIENDFVNTAYDGDIVAFAGGADYRVTDRIVTGVALSYENTDLNTSFNNGTFETDGFGISPYAVFRLNDKISVDINGSYTSLNTDTTRTGGAVTGSFDSNRYTVGGNLNLNHKIKKVFMNASVGFLYIKEDQDSYTESNGTFVPDNNISIGQGRLSASIGYDFGKFQPFVTAQLRHEFWSPSAPELGGGLQSPTDDNTAVVLGGGVSFRLTDTVSGSVTGTTEQGRDNFDLYSVTGRVRMRF